MDKMKTIKGLEALDKAMSLNQCYTCSHEFVDAVEEFGTNIIADAISLLKEKETVIRCKDCKNAEIIPWLDNAIICKKHSYNGVRPDKFYCADGERW